jgi:malonyl-CoA/methylmalonyl-CoA synthetase
VADARRTGAAVEFQRQFNPRALWRRLGAEPPITVFMGVPTMFVLLIRTLQAMPEAARATAAAAAGGLRLMVREHASGPISPLAGWHEDVRREAAMRALSRQPP